MQSSRESNVPVRPLLRSALASLGLTAAHHLYGGVLYRTPWRVHGAVVAGVAGLVLVAVASRYRRSGNQVLGYVLAAVTLALPVVAIGLFEGAYNHLTKNLLYFAHAPSPLLLRLFPPPTYEFPNDMLFEVSGVLQVIPAAFAALATARFLSALRAVATVETAWNRAQRGDSV